MTRACIPISALRAPGPLLYLHQSSQVLFVVPCTRCHRAADESPAGSDDAVATVSHGVGASLLVLSITTARQDVDKGAEVTKEENLFVCTWCCAW